MKISGLSLQELRTRTAIEHGRHRWKAGRNARLHSLQQDLNNSYLHPVYPTKELITISPRPGLYHLFCAQKPCPHHSQHPPPLLFISENNHDLGRARPSTFGPHPSLFTTPIGGTAGNEGQDGYKAYTLRIAPNGFGLTNISRWNKLIKGIYFSAGGVNRHGS